MRHFRKDDYSDVRDRPNVLTNYLESMVAYLSLQNPDTPRREIVEFVKNKIKERIKVPDVTAVYHKREGHAKEITVPLTKYIKEVVKDNNLSPSGSCYKPASVEPSLLRQSIEGKVAERNKYKKLYLSYEAQGMKRESQYYNQNQANAKIFNNAIAGGMNIDQFILGSVAGFNAITSVGRMSVKQAYGFIERAVNANIYLPTEESAISYVINHTRHIHAEFDALMERGILYVPSVDDVYRYLTDSMRNYILFPDSSRLYKTIENLKVHERSYVFYVGCIINLCRYNSDMMRTWIDSCFVNREITEADIADISIDDVGKFPDDVLACILSTNYQMLGMNPEKPGKWNSIKDAKIHNHEGLRKFIFVCRHFMANYEKMVYVLRPIMQINTTFHKLTYHDRMARQTVPLSDTDSNIFSNQELIRWKRGRVDFVQESYEMNAIITYTLSQALEHVFARLSAGFGAEGGDVFKISMKNEFLYPIMLVTSKGKHYLAIATMQEGSFLPNPRKDIKGVGFRSSAYPKKIRDEFEDFVVDLFAKIEKAEPIRVATILQFISGIEHSVVESVKKCESTYLQTVSIKNEQDYAKAEVSTFFYYKFWQEVFAPTYGDMMIPNKCFKIPLVDNGAILKDPEFLEELRRTQPDVHMRLLSFMERNPNRDLTAIVIPPDKGNINPFFANLMDLRIHISQIMKGYYLVMEALGIGAVYLKSNALVSDFYDPMLPEIT